MIQFFAAVALVLAAIEIYGVMAYLVVQGTRELGIRIALGASQGNIVGLVGRQGMALAFSGVAIGLAAALLLTAADSKPAVRCGSDRRGHVRGHCISARDRRLDRELYSRATRRSNRPADLIAQRIAATFLI